MRGSLILVVLVLLGLSVLAWRFTTERGRQGGRGESSATSDPFAAEEAGLARARDSLDEAPETVADAMFAREELPDDSPRIFGHVQPVGGWPADEPVELRAEVFGKSGLRPRVVRLAVGADGRFELRVPATTRHAMLAVESERLYQAEEVRALPEREIVLEPLLLACVDGTLRFPADASDEELAKVAVHCSFEDPWLARRTSVRVQPERDGALRLRLLPPEVELALRVETPWAPAYEETLAPLAAGERRALVVALERGLSVAGVVLDESGAPFAGASVQVFSLDGSIELPESADQDGRFELTGLARRAWRLRVSAEEAIEPCELELDGRSDLHDLVLTLRRGACLTGTVHWPDGSPVFDYEVTLHFAHDFRSTTVTAGDFRLCGLVDEPCALEIEATTADSVGTARAERVRPGGPPLALVLTREPAFTLAVEVRDRSGAPIVFHASASDRSGARRSTPGRGVELLHGLSAGTWLVTVEARGFRSTYRHVEIGPGTAHETFVLDPCARIRGRVEDGDGRAVSWAQVSGVSAWDRDSTRSEEDGRFELDALPGVCRLRASAPGFGPSETLTLTLGEEEVIDGVLLRLSRPCRLRGRVLDVDGKPFAGVRVRTEDEFVMETSVSDADGRFTLEGLGPGPLRVAAYHPSEEVRARASTTILADGDTTLELRFPPADPVRVRGRARLGGSPYTGELSWISSSASGELRCDAEGRFELELRAPGPWTVCRYGEELVPTLYALELEIPDVEEHELMLDLDRMRQVRSLRELGF
jgi:hypothetical protein